MIQIQRQEKILSYLDTNAYMSVSDAVQIFGASRSTISRVFDDLTNQKFVSRVRGGIKLEKNCNEQLLPFTLREVRLSQEKMLLAQKAASFIQPEDVFFADGGTTTYNFAQYVPDIKWSVVTNSIYLANALEQQKRINRSRFEVFLTGGMLLANSGFLVGPATIESIAKYSANWAFLSVSGITERGISNTSEIVAQVELSMIANAEKTVVLADHSKIGKAARWNTCDFQNIDFLITCSNANASLLEKISQAGVTVIQIPCFPDECSQKE